MEGHLARDGKLCQSLSMYDCNANVFLPAVDFQTEFKRRSFFTPISGLGGHDKMRS
jgi:hypothetical protein